jgi:transcription elongation factor GreA
MEKTTPLTQYAFDILTTKRNELNSVVNRKTKPTIERQREVNIARKELSEVEGILERSYVREFNEKQPAMVQIGCTVVLEKMDSSEKREYRIMTRDTANPLKGVISNESPIAQKMMGLNLKNTFKIRDNYGKEESYKIVSID